MIPPPPNQGEMAPAISSRKDAQRRPAAYRPPIENMHEVVLIEAVVPGIYGAVRTTQRIAYLSLIRNRYGQADSREVGGLDLTSQILAVVPTLEGRVESGKDL